MPRHLDRRVQRTRKSLREALLALILEEGYDEISILDITEKANLGRATFYLHFKDKDELLLEVMDQLVMDFLEQVPQLTAAHWHLEDTKKIVKLFEFAAEYYDLYRILTISKGGITAARQLQHIIASNIAEFIQSAVAAKDVVPALPIDFIANHFTGSLLSTIYWWLDHDLPYTPDEMAVMFQKINQLDREKLLGIDQNEDEQDTQEHHGKRKKRGKDKDQIPTAEGTTDPDPGEAEPEQVAADQEDKA